MASGLNYVIPIFVYHVELFTLFILFPDINDKMYFWLSYPK